MIINGTVTAAAVAAAAVKRKKQIAHHLYKEAVSICYKAIECVPHIYYSCSNASRSHGLLEFQKWKLFQTVNG